MAEAAPQGDLLRGAQRYPEILEDLAAKLTALLVEEGLPAARARDIAFRHAEQVRRDWGGQKIYVPMGQSYEVTQRDLEIYRRFDGRNGIDLCREYGITDTWLRAIITRAREADLKRRQSGLF